MFPGTLTNRRPGTWSLGMRRTPARCGSGGDSVGRAVVQVFRPGALRLEVSDSGRVFNPLEVPMPDLSAGLVDRPIGGLGLFLVRSLTDSLAYQRENGRNTVSFRFPAAGRAGT
jgi:anti-sigma regulatory factor (Ser/Thr protein kinase)